MESGLAALSVLVLGVLGTIFGRIRAAGLRRRLREASDSPPVDPPTGMVAQSVARLRLALEGDKATRLGVPLHVAVADIRGGDPDAADQHGAELAVDLHPSTVGVRAADSRFVLVSSVADPTAGIAIDQSIWALHRYVVQPGGDQQGLINLVEAEPEVLHGTGTGSGSKVPVPPPAGHDSGEAT